MSLLTQAYHPLDSPRLSGPRSMSSPRVMMVSGGTRRNGLDQGFQGLGAAVDVTNSNAAVGHIFSKRAHSCLPGDKAGTFIGQASRPSGHRRLYR